MVKKPAAPPAPAVGVPIAVRVLAVYGFVDEYGDRWHWDCEQIVRNPFVVGLLVQRRAPIETVKE